MGYSLVCRLAEQFLVLVPGSELRFYQKQYLSGSWGFSVHGFWHCQHIDHGNM
jgi:hypothetical protein